jgi:hypothetical protein
MNKTSSSIVAFDIIPDPENNQVFIFQQTPIGNESTTMDQVEQVVQIDEDELVIELGLDFDDYYDTDYEDEYEEDYEDDDYEDEIIQQFQTVDIDPCPGA